MADSNWLRKQYEKTADDIKKWPSWMRREAKKINSDITEESKSASSHPKKEK